MNKRTLKRIFNKTKTQLGLPEVRLIVRPMNKKLATASIKTNTITFNKKILRKISREEAETILLHELIHLKLKEYSHTIKFYRELNKQMGSLVIGSTLEKIIYNLLNKEDEI